MTYWLQVFYLFSLVQLFCCLDLYPYGINNGDTEFKKNESMEQLLLSKPMPLLSEKARKFYINKKAYIALNRADIYLHDMALPESLIFIYTDDAFELKDGSHIYYRETTNKRLLSKATHQIRNFTKNNDYEASQVAIFTYINLPRRYSHTKTSSTFQLVLVSNGETSFAIFNYQKLTEYEKAKSGIWDAKASCGRYLSQYENSWLLPKHSNVGQTGVYILPLTITCDVDLLPYGVSVGDAVLDFQESSYHNLTSVKTNMSRIKLSRPMLLFSRLSDELYISPDGIIAPRLPLMNKFVIRGLPGTTTFIAALVDDVKEARNRTFYREIFDKISLQQISKQINSKFPTVEFEASHAVVVTFYRLSEWDYQYTKTLYPHQVVLASDGKTTFGIVTCEVASMRDVFVEFSERFCSDAAYTWKHPIISRKNVNQVVWKLTSKNCRYPTDTALYPYGVTNLDKTMKETSEYEILELHKPVPLFGRRLKSLYIYRNGMITDTIYKNFTLPLAGISAFMFPGYKMSRLKVSDTTIYYREILDEMLLKRATNDVLKFSKDSFTALQAVAVTYNMDFVDTQGRLYMKRVQVVLAFDAIKGYIIFTYDRTDVWWAYRGYSNGRDGWTFLTLPWSDPIVSMDSNVNIPGRYVHALNAATRVAPVESQTETRVMNAKQGETVELSWNAHQKLESLVITCRYNGEVIAMGNPEVFIPNQHLRRQIVTTITNEKFVITLQNVTEDDAGNYTCKSTSTQFSINSSIKLSIYDVPKDLQLSDLVQFQINFRYSDLTLNGNPIGKKSLNILLEQAFRGEIRLNFFHLLQKIHGAALKNVVVKTKMRSSTVMIRASLKRDLPSQSYSKMKHGLVTSLKAQRKRLTKQGSFFHANVELKSFDVNDFNECSSRAGKLFCHQHAMCYNFPVLFTFGCKCKDGYIGSGFKCEKAENQKLDFIHAVSKSVSMSFSLDEVNFCGLGKTDLLRSEPYYRTFINDTLNSLKAIFEKATKAITFVTTIPENMPSTRIFVKIEILSAYSGTIDELRQSILRSLKQSKFVLFKKGSSYVKVDRKSFFLTDYNECESGKSLCYKHQVCVNLPQLMTYGCKN